MLQMVADYALMPRSKAVCQNIKDVNLTVNLRGLAMSVIANCKIPYQLLLFRPGKMGMS